MIFSKDFFIKERRKHSLSLLCMVGWIDGELKGGGVLMQIKNQVSSLISNFPVGISSQLAQF